MQKAHYSPPWANTSIIGVAGSSGSGKTSLALAIIAELSLPWVVIMSMDSFYKPLTPEQSEQAFRNEYDFDAPEAIDFEILVEKLREIKEGKKAELPVYSFEKHARLEKTMTIYSPHVLIVEGIFALHDQRVLDMLDLKWFSFVKPYFHKYVEPQREVADIIVPRGIENKVAISMVSDRIRKTLAYKSKMHQNELKRLGKIVEDAPLSKNVLVLQQSPQVVGIHTLLMGGDVEREDFIFYFDRVAALLVERATECMHYEPQTVETPTGKTYAGLRQIGETSAVVVLRGGSVLETGLKRVIPDCRTGRMLIQTSWRTGEPELHYRKLPDDIATHERVLLLDPQMSSGGAALMAVRVLVDHGVPEENIVFVTYYAGKLGVNRMMSVFPGMKVVVGRVVEDLEDRWIERRYLGC
ncbi:hypothetical protein LTR04_005869 [Oleoguttula sp. CCFEE 6159]|nr:hypothetical protein LTR04_005869 [Oleoguttula sp. CCFEE 6159]